VPVLHADEYRALIATRYDSTHPARALVGNADTYWQDEIYQTAIGHDHNLYASGGIAKTLPYRVSLGYTDKDGILKTDNFKRITAGINLNPGFFDNTLQVNVHFKSMFTKNHFADRGAIGNSLGFDPTHPVRDPESPYGGFYTWTIPASGFPRLVGAPTNPVALLELREDESNVRRFLTNISADYRFSFLPELRANLNLAYDHAFGEGTVVVPNFASFSFNAINGGGVNNSYEQTKINSLLEFYLNYKKQLGKNSIDLLGGYSWQHFEVENASMNSDAAGTPSETTSGSAPAEYYLLSMYGRVNYSYSDRYLLTVTLRRDGTSRFSPDNRWGLFPAVAAAVKLVDNDNSSLNSLKIRAGWGVTGQQDIGDYYAYLARYQLGNQSARYQFGEEFITTLRPNGYDENIRWEETTTLNVGLDFSIVRDRLSGSLDVYQRKTKDLLNRIPVPAGTNLTNFITTNIGNMENQGVELALFTTPLRSQNVVLDFGINVAYNTSEITKLTATDDPEYQGVVTGGIAGGVGSNIQIHTVGYAPRSFYFYEQL
jgi:iron complex outermembrane receptor protein